MRGHIRKRGKTWAVVVALGRDESGRYKQKWLSGFATQKEAQKKLTEVLSQFDTGSYVEPTKETVGGFLGRWLAGARPNLAPRTFEGYEHIVLRHLIPALGTIPLVKLTPQRLQAYYAEKLTSGRLNGKGGLSARTVRHHHVTLHDALQSAVKQGILPRNLADAVDPPKFERPEMHTLDEDGLNRFLSAAKETQWYPVFYMALFTGMRRSEVLALRWQDVDLDLGQVSVIRSMHRLRNGTIVFRAPKTAKSRRMVALAPSVSILLRSHWETETARRLVLGAPKLAGEDLVFCRVDGSPIPPDTITHAWAKLAKRMKLAAVRLHDARHTHATLMLKQGIHPKIVQERLGHATISTTLDIYSHVTPGMQEAAALRFDELLNVTSEPQPGSR